MKSFDSSHPERKQFDFDLDALLHPAQAFEHPLNVLQDLDLTLNEKRAILAAWASDACAVEAVPALRQAPGGSRAVPVDDILDALRVLDKVAHACAADPAKVRRMLRRKRRDAFDGRSARDSDESRHDPSA
jgi:hypothetical protein